MIGQSEKIVKVEKLFEQIKAVLPDNHISLSVHDIDMDNLPKKWEVSTQQAEHRKFKLARRNDETFDITLFGR